MGTNYLGSVTANPGNVVSYRIEVKAVSGGANNVTVADAIPNGLTNIGNVQINGTMMTGTNPAYNINLGNLSQGQSKTIIYDATVAAENNFSYGQTTLTNTATVTVAGSSANSSAVVQVYRRAVQGATTVSTGFDGGKYAGLGMGIAMTILGLAWAAYLVFGKKKIGAETLLSRKIAKIRKQNGLA
jgi:uncharacterized repeat protein (TIGR01451 family)